MNERSRYDVAIVGGGLVGASAALALDAARAARRAVRAPRLRRAGERRQLRRRALPGPPGRTAAAALRARRIWDRLPELIGSDGEFVVSGHCGSRAATPISTRSMHTRRSPASTACRCR
jgi:sarcosine oxidase subunit beta